MIGVASVLPFMSLMANPSLISEQEQLQLLYVWGGFSDERPFIVATGIAVILLLLLSRLFAILMNYLTERLLWRIYHRTSTRLLDYYISRPYRYFLNKNTADLRVYILQEVKHLTTGYLSPLINLIISGTSAIVIILLVLLVNPLVAISSALVLGGAYLLIYQARKRPLKRLGRLRQEAAQRRNRALEELLQGIKTVKTYGNEASFISRYREDTAILAMIHPRLRFMYQTPKNFLEIVAFSGIITVTLVLYLNTGELGKVMPTLTLFAVAGYRLLPALQQTFGSVATIRTHQSILDSMYDDLVAGLAWENTPTPHPRPLSFTTDIELKSLGFHFPGAPTPLFDKLSFQIRKGRVVAFVGATGSGKTTLVDLITGLFSPTSGTISVDGTPLGPETLAAWRQQLAYVPQDVFLYDATLRDNITFGLPPGDIPDALIMETLEMVDLKAFVDHETPQGLATLLGENGVRLSGGQRQRVGLARALLRQPSVLILDEATSALDTITEQTIIAALERLPKDLTILIIAHRLSTVRYADEIHLLESGQLIASGTYAELARDNALFRRMAELS